MSIFISVTCLFLSTFTSLRSDWAIFACSWQHIFSQKTTQEYVTFWAIFTHHLKVTTDAVTIWQFWKYWAETTQCILGQTFNALNKWFNFDIYWWIACFILLNNFLLLQENVPKLWGWGNEESLGLLIIPTSVVDVIKLFLEEIWKI